MIPGASPLPLGPRVERVLEIAYRARRAVLLEGATGIGKSEIVRDVAARLGLQTIVLDLSLLEPPDLVGLPVIEAGRTTFALPSALPTGGAGILMLEELNRAERYIQQPALQLLTARRLHEYVLPADWVAFAAVNPETSDYHVTPLDKALRARFLNLGVRADRAAWLAWAQQHGVHPGVIAVAEAHERVFEDVAPRTWTYVSDLLRALTDQELRGGSVEHSRQRGSEDLLVRDVLSGYLPPPWIETLLASQESWSSRLSFDVRALLVDYKPGSPLAKEVASFRDKGMTDRLDELTTRLSGLLKSPAVGVLLSQRAFLLDSFEALLCDLPGDHRERLQEALGGNPTAVDLVDVRPSELLSNFAGSAAEKKLVAFKNDPVKHHRVALAVTALSAHLSDPARLIDLKRSNVARTSLGHLLSGLTEKHAVPLAVMLKRLGITPVRP